MWMQLNIYAGNKKKQKKNIVHEEDQFLNDLIFGKLFL